MGSMDTVKIFKVLRLFKNRYVSKLQYTLHHINRAKLFTENSAMPRLRDILRGWGLAVPPRHTLTLRLGLKAVG